MKKRNGWSTLSLVGSDDKNNLQPVAAAASAPSSLTYKTRTEDAIKKFNRCLDQRNLSCVVNLIIAYTLDSIITWFHKKIKDIKTVLI